MKRRNTDMRAQNRRSHGNIWFALISFRMGPQRNYLLNFSNGVYYKQQRHMWACGKELGDRKQNHPRWLSFRQVGPMEDGGSCSNSTSFVLRVGCLWFIIFRSISFPVKHPPQFFMFLFFWNLNTFEFLSNSKFEQISNLNKLWNLNKFWILNKFCI
jgi:hypothetical protein